RDEAPLPGAVSVRVFRDHVEAPDRRQHPDLGGDATLVLDDIPLRGQIRERLVAGPLDEGGYHVAVRPHGFGLWWWLGADDLRRGASTIQTTLGETTEVGIETIFCGPTVELPLVARSGQPPPDVRDGGAVAEYRLLVDETPWQAADVRLLDDRIRVRGLPHGADVAGSPKGRAEIRVRYEHPHLLPVPEVAIRLEAELARGTLVEEPLHVEAIGGALGVRSDAAAVIVRSEESRLVAPLDAGEALVVSLMPGEYEVTVCRDVACEELQGEPHPVTITPARTSWLELP
ncbi:MAG: hypothetical protein JSV80_17360, partial [Acidobacteriota bacterium]